MKTKMFTLVVAFLFPYFIREKVEPIKPKIIPHVSPEIELILNNPVSLGDCIILTKKDTLNYTVHLISIDTIKKFEFKDKETLIPIERFSNIGVHQLLVIGKDSNLVFNKFFDVNEIKCDTAKMTYTESRSNSRRKLFDLIRKNTVKFELPDSFAFSMPLDCVYVNDNYGTYRIFQKYNQRLKRNETISIDFHRGIDFKATMGTNVKSVAPGCVVATTNFPVFGKTLVVYHGGNIYSLYFHLLKFKVEVGDTVNSGEIIALSGNGGTGPHLHFAVEVGETPVNFFELRKLFLKVNKTPLKQNTPRYIKIMRIWRLPETNYACQIQFGKRFLLF